MILVAVVTVPYGSACRPTPLTVTPALLWWPPAQSTPAKRKPKAAGNKASGEGKGAKAKAAAKASGKTKPKEKRPGTKDASEGTKPSTPSKEAGDTQVKTEPGPTSPAKPQAKRDAPPPPADSLPSELQDLLKEFQAMVPRCDDGRKRISALVDPVLSR